MDREVERAVYELVARQFSDDEEAIGAQTRFVDDLGADSAAVVELLTAVETQFGIDLTEEPAGVSNVVTVGDFARLVDAKLHALRYSTPVGGSDDDDEDF